MGGRDTDVVSVICCELAQRIGSVRYELYFANTSWSVHDDCVQLATPNRFSCDWLRSHFRPQIEAVCGAVLKQDVKVEFRVDAQAADQLAGTDADEPAPTMNGDATPASASEETTRPPRFQRRRFASLDSFVPGEANQIAYASAMSVVKQPGRVSPLFIYGPTGIGKTHLLEGVWNAYRRMPDRPRCLYVSAEQFTSAFLDALHGRGLPRFRRRFRDVDLLIIEDVQFFIGKKATISELQYTIESLLREGKQLAFSADRRPAQLEPLGTDLVNRFCGGLVLAMDAPDRATRQRIIEHGAVQRGIQLPQEVVDLVADRLIDDVRKLHGALNRLQAYHQAYEQSITLEFALDALGELFQAESRSVQLRDIERAVCDVFGVEAEQLKSASKTRNITQARQLAMWLARRHTRAALSEIGAYFGRRSHSTVISAEKKVNAWRSKQAVLRVTNRDCPVDEAIDQLQIRMRVG